MVEGLNVNININPIPTFMNPHCRSLVVRLKLRMFGTTVPTIWEQFLCLLALVMCVALTHYTDGDLSHTNTNTNTQCGHKTSVD